MKTAKSFLSFTDGFTFAFLSISIGAPLIVIVAEVFEIEATNWEHYRRYLLKDYLLQTIWLAGWVVSLSLVFGLTTAYFLARYEFWGRSFWRWGLVMPLAMPGYIVAYSYASFGFDWLINVWGCGAILALVLYPYIYLSVKAELQTQSLPLLEAGRLLGVGDWKVFVRVVLPLMRPAAFAGAALVAMEALNEYGAVKHFGINTLTPGLFKAWNALDDRGVAARLSVMLLIFTLLLVRLEKWQRRKLRYYSTKPKPILRVQANVYQTLWIWLICLIPFLLGFGLPFVNLLGLALKATAPLKLTQSFVTSLTLAIFVSFSAALLSMVLSEKKKFSSLVMAGYAIPGSVLAMGIVVFLSKIEKPLPVLLSGSYLALSYGYVLRFLAVGFAPIEAARLKINPSLEETAYMLGKTRWQAKRQIVYPLLRKSFWAAMVLFFVEIFKELPMTLVLRPFGFHSLATRAYELSSDEQLAQAAIPSLIIALVGSIPIIWLVKQSEK